MASWEPIQLFPIDDGQLDDYTAQQAFVIGFEFAQVSQAIRGDKPFTLQVHSITYTLLKEVFKTRLVLAQQMHDDWVMISG